MFIVSGVFKLLGDLSGLVGPLSISYIVGFINLQLSTEPQHQPAYQPARNASGAVDIGSRVNSSSFPNATTAKASEMLLINYPDWSEFIGNGWIMSCIVLIAFLLQGTFSQASTNLINMEGIKIKNALQGLIYRKTLSLSASCFYVMGRKADAADEADDDDYDLNNPGTITNLMSEDCLNVMTFFWICHYVWSIPLKVESLLWLS